MKQPKMNIIKDEVLLNSKWPTPVRSVNGYWIQICGPKCLVLHKFDVRLAQNDDGSGYNVFEGLKEVNSFYEPTELGKKDALDSLIEYMDHYNIKIEKDCCILFLPERLYK